tara:strand:+ start:928 stop:1134 length:207 start_codon:yes stop_codon:yes gene_type:complete
MDDDISYLFDLAETKNKLVREFNSILDESKQLEIMTKRYNFVVDLLDEDQQRTLHQWYVDTGVLKEEE